MSDIAATEEKRALNAQRVRELFDYNPASGFLTRSVTVNYKARAGAVAGHVGTRGYRVVDIDGRRYPAHHVIWLWVMGEWPTHKIDHFDIDKANNCWDNLREATNAQNAANTRICSRNTSGIKGVSWNKQSRKWQAHIMVDGRSQYLGMRNEREAAATLYAEAARQAFGNFARTA